MPINLRAIICRIKKLNILHRIYTQRAAAENGLFFGQLPVLEYAADHDRCTQTEIAENLQKQGGFIEGVRPGLQTERYLQTTVNRLILFGSLTLGLIAIMPFAADYVFAQLGINVQNLAIGGTGLLIVVTVGL